MVSGGAEGAVEPAEEVAHWTAGWPFRFEQQRAQRRAQRQCVERGEQHRYSNGDGELLIKPAARMSAIATTGLETCSIAAIEASLGDMPSSMWCSTASTTTMASSTTRPMASTKPSKESVLMGKPSAGKTTNVPMRETGTASSGMRVARHPCRKT